MTPATDNQHNRQDPMSTNQSVPAHDYVVTNVGANYRLPGSEYPSETGLRGQVITLDEQEAKRLLGLGAIQPATDADRARRDARLEQERLAQSTPERSMLLDHDSYAEHAAEQLARAQGGAR